MSGKTKKENVKEEQNLPDLWQSALNHIELRVSQGNFLTWFRQTAIKERHNDIILIETPSPFAFEWLSKKYRPLIFEALTELDPTIKQLDFCVTSKNSPQKQHFRRDIRVVAHKKQPIIAKTEPINQEPVITAIKPTTKQVKRPMPFNSNYTFKTFVVGTSNEIAYAACQAVAEKPGVAYNPLFIYGGVGLGKTHLLQATANEIVMRNPHFTVIYVASETFTNEFVEAIRKKNQKAFKDHYRKADLLVIDDIQFLAGKQKTQEELFHTFNTLHSEGKQLILSSDRAPSAIPAFHERLSSRLGAGMIVDVKKPDFETRLAILEEKAGLRNVEIDSEALTFIAKHFQNNVRDLEGALNRVIGHAEVHREKVTTAYVEKILKDSLNQSQHKTITSKEILSVVSSYYNLSNEEICGKRRNKEIVRPRQIAMYLLRKENNMSFPSIGECFGGRDHTTAMHACEKIEKLLDHDEELSQEVSFLRERLYA